MIKNGLFLCSIGLLVFLYTLNPQSMEYNVTNLLIALILIASGSFCVWRGTRQNTEKRQ